MHLATLLPDILVSPVTAVLVWERAVVVGAAVTLLALELGLGLRRFLHRPTARCRKALRDLEHAAELVRPGNAYALSFALAEAVRGYLEHCCDAAESRLPTSRYLESVRDQVDGVPGERSPMLASFRQHCEMAKTADPAEEIPAMEALLESARRLVRGARWNRRSPLDPGCRDWEDPLPFDARAVG